MLTARLLLFALAGCQAIPLRHNNLGIQKGGRDIRWAHAIFDYRQGTQNSQATLVDIKNGELLAERSEMERKVNYYNPQAYSEYKQATQNSQTALVDIRTGEQLPVLSEMQRRANGDDLRQDSETSRRFLVDLNTGLLKEHIIYNPQALFDYRQGTQNSQATLVDIRTGELLAESSEMERKVNYYNPQAYSEYKQGTQNSQTALVDIRTGEKLPVLSEMQRRANVDNLKQDTKPSRRFLVDTGLLKEHTFYNPQALFDYRQGTQNSQATLVDIRTGELLAESSEMERKVNYYNPQAYSEYKQGTQNSQTALVDIRTGEQLPVLSEMQRRANVDNLKKDSEPSRHVPVDPNTGLLSEHTIYNPQALFDYRQGTQNSQATLVDIRTGELLAESSEMERKVNYYNPQAYSEYKQGTQNSQTALVDIRTGEQLPVLSEMQRRANVDNLKQDTKPSRRFLVDTGLLKEHTFYNPQALFDYRQGTQNSQATLVDIRTGELLAESSEMERKVNYYNPQAYSEYKQGTQNSQTALVDIRTGEQLPVLSEMQRRAEVSSNTREHTQSSYATLVDAQNGQAMSDVSVMQKKVDDKRLSTCQGMINGGKCFIFNTNLQTFSEAEVSCQRLSTLGHLASVSNPELHAQLVNMVTSTKSDLMLTWLGGIKKNNQFQWTDGTTWEYSDWIPGHPKIQEHKQLCVMLKSDENSWAAVDCDLKRASICSYPAKT